MFNLLLTSIGPSDKAFAIDGTSEIGKSLFFVYILYRIIRGCVLSPARIVYQQEDNFMLYDLHMKITRITEQDAVILVGKPASMYIID